MISYFQKLTNQVTIFCTWGTQNFSSVHMMINRHSVDMIIFKVSLVIKHFLYISTDQTTFPKWLIRSCANPYHLMHYPACISIFQYFLYKVLFGITFKLTNPKTFYVVQKPGQNTRRILGLCPANKRRCYKVTLAGRKTRISPENMYHIWCQTGENSMMQMEDTQSNNFLFLVIFFKDMQCHVILSQTCVPLTLQQPLDPPGLAALSSISWMLSSRLQWHLIHRTRKFTW